MRDRKMSRGVLPFRFVLPSKAGTKGLGLLAGECARAAQKAYVKVVSSILEASEQKAVQQANHHTSRLSRMKNKY
jgi:hypothetical protein